MKHYKNFKEAFAAASLDFSLWSQVVKHAHLTIIRGTSEITIKIFQELDSPINWDSTIATEIETHKFKPTKNERGFETVIIKYVYDEN